MEILNSILMFVVMCLFFILVFCVFLPLVCIFLVLFGIVATFVILLEAVFDLGIFHEE